MLEYFTEIWKKETGAKQLEIEVITDWMKDNSFPECNLPESYLNLMRESNGGNFGKGEREYQMLSFSEVSEYYDMYLFSEFMPYAYPFAMDGCGNFYLFNMRWKDANVYMVHACDMGWEEEQYYTFATSFEECILRDDGVAREIIMDM